jgi:hypothetical protein
LSILVDVLSALVARVLINIAEGANGAGLHTNWVDQALQEPSFSTSITLSLIDAVGAVVRTGHAGVIGCEGSLGAS